MYVHVCIMHVLLTGDTHHEFDQSTGDVLSTSDVASLQSISRHFTPNMQMCVYVCVSLCICSTDDVSLSNYFTSLCNKNIRGLLLSGSLAIFHSHHHGRQTTSVIIWHGRLLKFKMNLCQLLLNKMLWKLSRAFR